jgi:hypothetical protein
MQYNSSFAGQAGSPRFSSNIRYGQQGSDYSSFRGFITHASYDQFIPAIRSGIGIIANYGCGNLKNDYNYNSSNVAIVFSDVSSQNTSLTLAIAPKISFRGKYTLSPSVDFTYGFADVKRTTNPKLDTIFDADVNFLTVRSRAGLLFNANKVYIGYSVDLFNQIRSNKEGLLGNKGFFSDVQMGYTFERSSAAKFSFTPQLAISIVKDWYTSRVKIGLQGYNANFRYRQFIWGLNDGAVLFATRGNSDRRLSELGGIHVGWQTEKFRVMLTNAYSKNTYFEEFRYTGNLSFRYILGNKDQRPGRGW